MVFVKIQHRRDLNQSLLFFTSVYPLLEMDYLMVYFFDTNFNTKALLLNKIINAFA